MKVIKVTKNCYCVPTTYGKILNFLCKPLYWLSRVNQPLYKFLFKYLSKSHNYSILVCSLHLFK